jgi:monoterpene epsilon-lactone hydrolase
MDDMSEELLRIRSYLMKKKRENAGEEKPTLARRAEADASLLPVSRLPEGAAAQKAEMGGVPALWVCAPDVSSNDDATVLYFHGGGFISGSPELYKGFAAALSAACGARVLLPGCRLAPEHLYPAAHEDALASYRGLRASGVPAAKIALGGDSAGGMLALATMLSLRDAGEALPTGAFLLSPWLDITDFDSETYQSRAELDPIVDARSIARDSEWYFGSMEARKSADVMKKSPKGLPPLLIQAGDREVLLGDAQRLEAKAKAAGVDVTLEVWPELWHVFQLLTGMLPEAREAVGHIGGFVRGRMAGR